MYHLRPGTPMHLLCHATTSDMNADSSATQYHGIISCNPVDTGASRSIENTSGASNLANNPADRQLDYVPNVVAADVSVNHPDRVDGYD